MQKNAGLVVGFIGVIFCLIGSVLPWAEYYSSLLGSFTISGLDGDGKITLMLSIVVIILLAYVIFTQHEKQIRIIGITNLLLSILIGIIALNVSMNLLDSDIEYMITGEGASSGFGLSLVLFGSFFLFLSGIFHIVTKVEKKTKTKQKSDRYCPNCGRGIPFDAKVCPYCAKKFDSLNQSIEDRKEVEIVESDEVEFIESDESNIEKFCSDCGRTVPDDARACPYCGEKFDDKMNKHILDR